MLVNPDRIVLFWLFPKAEAGGFCQDEIELAEHE